MGEFKMNYKEGFALFVQENGNIQHGFFKNDKIVEEQIRANISVVEDKDLNALKSPAKKKKNAIAAQKELEKQKQKAQEEAAQAK